MSNISHQKKWFVTGLVLVCSIVLLFWAVTFSVDNHEPKSLEITEGGDQGEPGSRQLADPVGEQKPGYVLVGGVWRPETDVKSRPRKRRRKRADSTYSSVGQTPVIRPDANPYVVSVAEALKGGQHPERVTPMISPAAFDQKAYESNPRKYLETVEPGRVWQSASPGPDVPTLKMVTSRYQTITQGESTVLSVKAVAEAPVTFTSFDLGAFENQLTSITVAADDEGVARARFLGTRGTIEDVNVLASSPVTAGQAKFIVNVQLPRKADAALSSD